MKSASPKITVIGAGGLVFPIRLIIDILSFSELQAATISLMDIDAHRLGRTEKLARQVVAAHKFPAKIEASTNRLTALKNADFVLVAFQVGGLEAYKIDKDIARKYGIDLCVGDTLNSGGIFRGLRSIPVYQSIAADMKKVCPGALLLNYANPMAINCWALNNTGVKTVGLCHSVQGTTRLLTEQVGVPYEEVKFTCFGINHQAWITELTHGKRDLYPKLRKVLDERFPSPALKSAGAKAAHGKGGNLAVDHGSHYYYERVRTEIMRTFTYFHTESSHHGSEYTPWFRKNQATIKAYINKRWDYYDLCAGNDWKNQAKWIQDECKKPLECSEEYGARIIHSMVTDEKRVIYGNVPNWGAPGSHRSGGGHLIPNLPQDCCVEVACLVDRNGIQPTIPGPLPAQCAAVNQTNVNVQALTVLASETGDPKMVEAAVAMDPLTGALLTLPKIRDLTRDMLQAQKRWLPQFKKLN